VWTVPKPASWNVSRRNPSVRHDEGPVAHKGLVRCKESPERGAWSPAGERRDAVAILVVNEAEERADGTGRRRPMCLRC
jgi:hypothetical protein